MSEQRDAVRWLEEQFDQGTARSKCVAAPMIEIKDYGDAEPMIVRREDYDAPGEWLL